MRFYRINYFVSDKTATSTEWATTRREADKIARDNACGDYLATVTPVDIPTDKAGLLAFLNENIWNHPHATQPYGGDPSLSFIRRGPCSEWAKSFGWPTRRATSDRVFRSVVSTGAAPI